MFLNSWSLALSLCSLIVLFLTALAGWTAIQVLRFWDPASDDTRQIRLESETWLASTLVEYGLGFQIVSLVLFVLAADHYCEVIPGAMCATGALTANGFGLPALLLKMAGVFIYGGWIVLHQLDIRSESYPLVRPKYIYLLLLLPFLAADIVLQTLYIAHLRPDIITSCCAVVFSTEAGSGPNLLGTFSQPAILTAFYGAAGILVGLGVALASRWRQAVALLYAGIWGGFLILALVAVTTVFSSYIYAMPFHHCPFCLLKTEYHYIGFALYGTLLLAAFFGMGSAVIGSFGRRVGLERVVPDFQRSMLKLSLLFLAFFLVLSSYHYLLYLVRGGES